jgi:benzoyl-CoA-dihydrodiol lyase
MHINKDGIMGNAVTAATELITFDKPSGQYNHWRLAIDGRIATLAMDVKEDCALKPGYRLKLNSYDLGVDIELHDALQRIRFEHPEVACVVLTSARERMFCAGANIYMLGSSSHAWKVNFCKFTNETRNGMEDSSRHDGLKFLAALNGTTAGGGYEMALACDEIILIDDRSSAVSLPEVPLLGVLPGTGGLTRLVDKRKVRRDLADVFCTNPDGIKGERAKQWGLVDEIAPPAQFQKVVRERAETLVQQSGRPGNAKGIHLTPLNRTIDDSGFHYRHVDVAFDREARTVTLLVRGPEQVLDSPESIHAAGDQWWPLAMARELDDAILLLRTNELDLGLLLLKSEGSIEKVLASDAVMLKYKNDWLVRETIGMLRRTFARLDVSSRSMYAIVEPGSCFAGVLYELILAADRSYMLALPQEDGPSGPQVALDAFNFGLLPTVNNCSRLHTRFLGSPQKVGELAELSGKAFSATEALRLGLVTVAPDDLDWEDEIRLAIEERSSLSPDALTGMEASLRFAGEETLETKIFGRLSAWQNWVFIRPNSTGEHGALKLFGSGSKARFTWERV